MNSRIKSFFTSAVVATTVLAWGFAQKPKGAANKKDAAASKAHRSGGEGPMVFDCRHDEGCPQVVIQGTPSAELPTGQPGPFRGIGDPSVRQDPLSGMLWLSYTHVTTHIFLEAERPVPDVSVSTQLARSEDQGATWKFDHVVRAAEPETNQGPTGGSGYSGYEVSTLAAFAGRPGGSAVTTAPPRSRGRRAGDSGGGPGPVWYTLSHRYHNPVGPAGGNPNDFRGDSHHFVLDEQPTPSSLGSGLTQRLAGFGLAPGWGSAVNLSSLHESLAGCAVWTEPALHVEPDTLYLLAQCLAASGGQLRRDQGFLALFSAPAGQKPVEWQFAGKLAGHAEAQELDSRAVELTQGDVVRARDGTLLLIVTPNEIIREEVHLGCQIMEVEQINPPRLKRIDGKLVVRAIIRQSDAGRLGTGACAYDAASNTGVLMVHRTLGQEKIEFTLHATGVHP